MKFVHIADIHFDSPFSTFMGDLDLVEKRKLEQRNSFKKVINYVKENNVDYLFISGDIFENEHVKMSTIEFINGLFKEIENTKIFITPGNHDPNIKDGIYDTFEFCNNVKIFKSESVEKYEDENIEVYGFGFENFYMDKNPLENFELTKTGKKQILIMHADLNGVKDASGMSYAPISENKLRDFGFDYVALGHIHKTNYKENSKIIYPGSLVSLGFDELGSHGMITGEFNGNYLKLNYEPVDEFQFLELEVDVTGMNSQNDLIEHLTTLYVEKNNFCRVILVGRRRFVISIKNIMNLLDNSCILRIKDETSLAYNIEEIAKENNLKGIFVRKLLDKKENGFYSEEEIEKAIEIGLEAME